MRIGDGHEFFGLEKISHRNLIGQRLFDGLPPLAAQHLFFLIRQMHCPAIYVCPLQELTARPDDRTDIGLERTRPSGGRGGFYLFSFISIQ